MILFGLPFYRAVRHAMERDQGRLSITSPPLWRLLVDEVALLAVRVGRTLVSTVALLVVFAVLAVLVGLAESTPGPSLALAWRALVAACAGAGVTLVWAVVHALRRDDLNAPP